jgi:hypothetical protein
MNRGLDREPDPLPKELKTAVSRAATTSVHAASEFLAGSGTVSGDAPRSISGPVFPQEENQLASPGDSGATIYQGAQVPKVQSSPALPSRTEASGIDLQPSPLELQAATKKNQPSFEVPMTRLAGERIGQPGSELRGTPASATPGSVAPGQNLQLTSRKADRITTNGSGATHPSKQREVAEQTRRNENTVSFKLTPTPPDNRMLDGISMTSDPRGSQSRITIGRIEVQVNNVTRPVENKARAPVATSISSDFLEDRYLNRFPIKP